MWECEALTHVIERCEITEKPCSFYAYLEHGNMLNSNCDV